MLSNIYLLTYLVTIISSPVLDKKGDDVTT